MLALRRGAGYHVGNMPKKKEADDFGAGFAELETIAAWFERGEPALDEGLAKFERAMTLVKQLKMRLQMAETRIQDMKK